MRILIAEDDLASRRFISKVLSQYGETDMTIDGIETIDAYLIALKEKKPYDLICLDIMMPKVDGVKVLKAIRDIEKKEGLVGDNRIRVIITSALAESQIAYKILDIGWEAYVAKPIDTAILIDVIRKLGLLKLA